MTSEVMALVACANVRVLVKTATVRDVKATAPVGKGSSTSPNIVERNIDKSVQAWRHALNCSQIRVCTQLCRIIDRDAGAILDSLTKPDQLLLEGIVETWTVTPSGTGIRNLNTSPTATVIANGTGLAPWEIHQKNNNCSEKSAFSVGLHSAQQWSHEKATRSLGAHFEQVTRESN